MTTTKQGTEGKKAGAKKKAAAGSTPNLELLEGGKGKLMLSDGKTPASVPAMKKALGVYGVAFKPDASPADLLAAVRKHLTKVLKPMKDEDKVKCAAVCLEVATADTDFCPFCGDEGGEIEDSPVTDDTDEPEPTAAVVTPAAPAAAGKKPESATPAAAKTTAVVKAPTTAAGIAVAGAKLDASISRIKDLRRDLANNSYDLAVEIRLIHEEELWKARGHESFKDFIEKDLEMSRAMAYRLMDLTKQFDRSTFESVGATKLALVSGIQDAEARDVALEAAKAGATTKDVKRAADTAKGRTPAPAPEKKASSRTPAPAPEKKASSRTPAPAPEKKASSPAPKKGSEMITLLAKVGSKPQTHGWRSASSGRPIQSHKDDAFVEFALSEDVKQRIALKVDREGNILGVTVAFVRVE